MKSVMIVDDENHILEKAKKYLENDNFKVYTALDNRKALEMLSNDNESDFGLFLIESTVPGTDKTALYSVKPKSTMSMTIENKDEFLEKPFTKDQLLNFVRKKI